MRGRSNLFLVLIIALASAHSRAAQTPSRVNLNPDPCGPPWYVDSYVVPDTRVFIERHEIQGILGRLKSQSLPSRVNTLASVHIRPVFVQDGGSCGSASRICYMFAYELNSYRNLYGHLAENIYPSHFTWLLTYQNSSKDQMARANGVPNSVDYGGDTYSAIYGHSGQDCTDPDYGWMTGYDRWYAAMFNRLDKNTFLPLDTPGNLDVLKSWVYNHHGDADFDDGGVAGAGCAITGVVISQIPGGYYEEGKDIVVQWGPTIDHGTTWAGYDDDVAYDFNGDGQVTNDIDITGDMVIDMADWEIGALIMLNSWGSGWANNGWVYVPYRLLKINSMEAEFYHIRKAYAPRHVMKVLMEYSERSEIKIGVGIAGDSAATSPEKTVACHHFIFAGNGEVPMLGRWADEQMHTEPMEFGYDLTDLAFGFDTRVPYKYFLKVETAGGATGTGTIHTVSVMDYTADPDGVEIASEETGVVISGGGGTTLVGVSMPCDSSITPEYIYIPQSEIAVHYYDSQETVGEDGRAVNAIDGDQGTIWHTRWYGETDSLPHEIQIDLGSQYEVAAVQYLPRQDSPNGRIATYEIYVSPDDSSWGVPVASGTWANTPSEETVTFTPRGGRYARLVALSEVNGNPWTSVAELQVLRNPCTAAVEPDLSGEHALRLAPGCPNPFERVTRIRFAISTPQMVSLRVYNARGQEVAILIDRTLRAGAHTAVWNASGLASGVYFCRLRAGETAATGKMVLLR